MKSKAMVLSSNVGSLTFSGHLGCMFNIGHLMCSIGKSFIPDIPVRTTLKIAPEAYQKLRKECDIASILAA